MISSNSLALFFVSLCIKQFSFRLLSVFSLEDYSGVQNVFGTKIYQSSPVVVSTITTTSTTFIFIVDKFGPNFDIICDLIWKRKKEKKNRHETKRNLFEKNCTQSIRESQIVFQIISLEMIDYTNDSPLPPNLFTGEFYAHRLLLLKQIWRFCFPLQMSPQLWQILTIE